MSVMLRFQRIGRPKKAYFRLVAIDKRSKRNGKTLEVLGQYDPKNAKRIQVQEERISHWISQGAQASDSVRTLLAEAGIWSKVKSAPNPKNS